MEEHQVTVDGVPRLVPEPFIVLATQNPIELDGTYELPEAQLDRFMMRIHIGYPDALSEMAILDQDHKRWDRAELAPALDATRFSEMTRVADRVHVGPLVKEYLVRLSHATRIHPDSRIGVSPAAPSHWRVPLAPRAAANGRHFVAPDDVRLMAPHVLPHRIVTTPEAELRGATGNAVVADVLTQISVDETARS